MTTPQREQTDDPVSRAEQLLQRYFDQKIEEEEVAELLELWDRHPELTVEAQKNYEVNLFLRVLSRLDWDRRNRFAYIPPPPPRFRSLDLAIRPPDNTNDIEKINGSPTMDELARIVGQSHYEAEKSRPSPSSMPKTTTAARSWKETTPSSFVPLWILVLLLLVGFGFLIFQEWKPNNEHDLVQFAPGTPLPAVLIDRDDVLWATGTKPPKLGEPLLPGSLRFESGSIELLFYSGVRSIIEGPAELILMDDLRVFCKQGRWSVNVPPRGKGFEIQTSHLTVRDLGTRFYADVRKDRCDLHVLEGLVETEKHDGEKMRFETDQAGSFQGSDLSERMTSVTDHFVTKTEMRRRSEAFWQTAFTPTDPEAPAGPVVAVDFEGGEGSRLPSTGQLDAVTAVLWIRPDAWNREVNPILMSEGRSRNGIVWHLREDGNFLVGLRYRSGRVSGVFQTPVVLTPEHRGEWLRLALAIDGQARRLAVYVNDDPVLVERLPIVSKIDLNRLDAAAWKSASSEKANIQRLDGAVGTVLLYDRVLGIDEIRGLDNEQ